MKALVLMSGGLDSTLAAKLMLDQGIRLIALNFKTPFCLCDGKNSSGCFSRACHAAKNLGIEIKVINVTQEFFEVIKNPGHGYGSQMNPCIDCRILKFRKAKEFMQDIGASFIITGEVLGQRPMSQHRRALSLIDKESRLEGLILRPLSAKLFTETIPEKMGWVSRDTLLNFNGRTRKPQIELAKKFNIKDYPCPAGGCLLTDPEFAKKLKDLISYGELTINSIELLKVGRYFRISDKARLIVGRNERENERLFSLAEKDDYLFRPHQLMGPGALGRGILNEDLIRFSCRIVSRYCDLDGKTSVNVVCRKGSEEEIIEVSPIEEKDLTTLRL